MPSKIVIWGTGGHAQVVADIIRLVGEHEIVGFLDDVNPHRQDTTFLGASVLGGREKLDEIKRRGVNNLIFGFGDCQARLRLSGLVREKGFSLAAAVHPRAIVAADVAIGEGTVIAAAAVINPGSKIGENVIINTSASVDHNCVIEDGAHIAPGSHLAGEVRVGSATWIGIGAIVRERIRIGPGSIIGAGAVVLDDIPEKVLAYGVPARVIKRL